MSCKKCGKIWDENFIFANGCRECVYGTYNDVVKIVEVSEEDGNFMHIKLLVNNEHMAFGVHVNKLEKGSCLRYLNKDI